MLAKKYHLPLFLHSRAAHIDLVKILKEEGFSEDGGKSVGAKGGVVHSFTGSSEEAAELVSTLHPPMNLTIMQRTKRLVWDSTSESTGVP